MSTLAFSLRFHRKSVSHNHSCRYNNEHDVVVYTVIKDSGMHKARAPSPSLPLWGPMVKKCPCSRCFFCRGRGFRYDSFWSWTINVSTFCFFLRIPYYPATAHILSVTVLVPPYQYTVQRTYIHISVNSGVELLSRDTALIHNQKS